MLYRVCAYLIVYSIDLQRLETFNLAIALTNKVYSIDLQRFNKCYKYPIGKFVENLQPY